MSEESKAAIRLFIAEIIRRLQYDNSTVPADVTGSFAEQAHRALTRYALMRFRQLADAVVAEWKTR